jgi:tetratricopeptide (TPR) repeat protein
VATVAEAFALALQHHQGGNLRQAEHLLRQILQVDPRHVGAWSGLGIVMGQQGNLAEAAVCFQQLVQLQPDDGSARVNLGLLESRQGRQDTAIGHFQSALRLQPQHVEAHFNLGNALRYQCKVNEAIASYRQVLDLQPDHVHAQNNLGALLLGQGHLEEAISCFQRALQLKPDLAETCNNLGNAYVRQDKVIEAIANYRRCLEIRPNFAEGWYNLGNALKGLGKLDEAVQCYRESLRLKPGYAEAYNNLGSALTLQEKLDEAIIAYQEALRIKPNYDAAYYNWANALARQDKLDEAIQHYHRALQLKPDNPAALTNLGNLHHQRGEFAEALTCFHSALKYDPGHAETHFNRALLLLLKGDWAQGWPEYEWRLQTPDFPPCPLRQPRWDGSPLAGRTLLVLAEQGLGDTMLFVRFVLLLRQRGDHVVLQCQPPMLPFLSASMGAADLVPQGGLLPHFDVYSPLLSLPGVLGAIPTNIPADIPYLHANSGLVQRWRQEMSGVGRPASGVGKTLFDTGHQTQDTGRAFKVGIAWQGTRTFRGDRQRSIPLKNFAALSQVDGVQLISLQKGSGVEHLGAWPGPNAPATLGNRFDECGAFTDTAAVMRRLDLIVSSDTALPHLAGALGVPVWVALALVPDWRWQLQREDCQWYPTMRLFRQKEYGRWEEAFDRMAAELTKVVRMQSG